MTAPPASVTPLTRDVAHCVFVGQVSGLGL